MTPNEFQIQMNRLSETFGKTVYGTERARLIWETVKEYPVSWFGNVVGEMIGTLRHAPLLPEFRDAVSKERERRHWADKDRFAQEAKDFWKSSYTDEDQAILFATIKRRLRGEMTDQDFAAFKRSLEDIARGSEGVTK